MRSVAAPLFIVCALAGAVAAGVIASRSAHADDDGDAALPADAASFGLVVRGRTPGDIAVLEATCPFDVALPNGVLTGTTPAGADAVRARALVARELGRYPRSFARRIRLRGVVLAASLEEAGRAIPSLPNVGGLLFIDVVAAEPDFVRAIHHEVFHFADLADDGRLGEDRAWSELNVRGTRYGSGGRTLRGAWAAKPSPDLPGFVTAYATSAACEDKAETFSYAVARPEALLARARVDSVVAAKARAIVRLVEDLDPAAPAALGLERLR